MGEVVKLVSNAVPREMPCATCAFYHPDTKSFGTKFGGWFKPRVPTALAIRFAICSARGGYFANLERHYDCKGKWWEPKP